MFFRLTPRGLGALAAVAIAASLMAAAPRSNGTPVIARYINGVPDTGQFLPDTLVLARVDNRAFSVGEYVVSYYNSYAEDRPQQDSLGRVEFLNTLINKEMLGRTARDAGYQLGFEDRAVMREHRERVLSNILFLRAIADSAIATGAEIQRVYEQYKYQQHFRHILFVDRVTAERVRLDLLRGRIGWKEAVKRYSQATGDPGPDGDMGWTLRPGQTFAIAEVIYGLKPGEISQAFEDQSGWQLVQSVETKPATPPSLSSMRTTIVDQIRNYRSGELTERLQTLLAARAHFTLDTANVTWACKFFGTPNKMERDETGGATLNIDPNVPEFSPADTLRVLARWEAGQMSLGEFLHSYSGISPIMRPPVGTLDQLGFQVSNFALEPYKSRLAEERGYDKEPMAVAQIEARREQILVERMYEDSVMSRVHVTRAERQQYYEKHKPGFITYPSVRFAAVARHGKPAADSLVARLKAGARAEDVILADSLAGHPTGSIKSLRENEHGPFHKLVFEELRPGQVTTLGPDKTDDYAVVQLLEFNPGRQLSFAESEGMIDESLQNEKSEAALQQLLKRLRPRFHITMRPELVMLVRLVDPTL